MCSVTTHLPAPAPSPFFRSRAVEALPIQVRVARARQMPTPKGGRPPLVDLMAARLIHHETGTGAATDADIARDGFTAAEIKRHGEEARDVAASRLVRRMLGEAA